MRNVRQMVKRIERAGYTTEVCRVRDVAAGRARAAPCADAAAWRSTETERGFSMALGRVVDPADPDCVWVVARQDGVVRAFLQFVPWGADGMSLDLMRRDRTAEAGRQRAAHRRTPSQAAPDLGVHAGVAQLRRLPLRPRAGRAARRRPGPPGLAPGAAVRLALVPDREPLPLQRQVPADVGSRGSSSTRTRPTCRGSALAALEAEAFLTWPSSLRSVVSREGHGAAPVDGLPVVMGVVNVTPDSFSDGGEWFEPAAAVAHGLELLAAGRRPARRRWRVHPARRRAPDRGGGAAPGAARRGRALAGRGRAVSVDTMRAEVAAQALRGRGQRGQRRQRRPGRPRRWPRVVADSGAPYVAMHWRGHSTDMQSRASYDDVVAGRVPRAGRAGRRTWGRGRAPRAARARPRVRVRQAGRAQLARCCAHLDRVQALGLPGARRHLAQVVPRPAGRAGRRPAAAAGRARRRDGGDHGPSPRWPGPGACGCTTCPPAVDALARRRGDWRQAR